MFLVFGVLLFFAIGILWFNLGNDEVVAGELLVNPFPSQFARKELSKLLFGQFADIHGLYDAVGHVGTPDYIYIIQQNGLEVQPEVVKRM
jgi:hypothetical protein|tara:strand:- start:2328 stop:2597 length:270 start_codon:yes stop_codon:yes gene_type:complete